MKWLKVAFYGFFFEFFTSFEHSEKGRFSGS